MPPFSKVQLALPPLTERARGSGSRFDRYLRSWPSALPELPTEADVLAVGCNAPRPGASSSSTRSWLEAQHSRAAEAFARSSEKGEGERGAFPSLEAFCAAVRLVGSRCLRCPAGQFGERRFLVPVLDMANHDGARPAALFRFRDEEEPAMQLVAARPLRNGDAVTICYGELSNAELVLGYGFVPRDENPHDYELVSLCRLLSRPRRRPGAPCPFKWATAVRRRPCVRCGVPAS